MGFEVSKPVLERAFARTYSLEMSSIFFSEDLAIGSYRHAASSVIPKVTKVAWHLKKDEIQNSHPNETKAQFIYHMSKSEYRKDWGKIYEKPGVVARVKALFLKIMPKVGPFSDLAFHPPTPAVEQLYTHSVNLTLQHYRTLLHAQQEGKLELTNENLDTGSITTAASYRLSDDTYAELVEKTSGKSVSEALRRDLLAYHADLEKPFATKRNSKAWRELVNELNTLKSMAVASVSVSSQ